MSKSPRKQLSSSSSTAFASAPAWTTTCAERTFIPLVIVHTCRSWISLTPVHASTCLRSTSRSTRRGSGGAAQARARVHGGQRDPRSPCVDDHERDERPLRTCRRPRRSRCERGARRARELFAWRLRHRALDLSARERGSQEARARGPPVSPPETDDVLDAWGLPRPRVLER